jgi:hypothetical protein
MIGSTNGWFYQWLVLPMVGSTNGWFYQWLESIPGLEPMLSVYIVNFTHPQHLQTITTQGSNHA